MTKPIVKSVNVGLPVETCFQGKLTKTGIFKVPVKSPVFLSKTNLTGDGQADLKYHGGPDKALCIYCYEHYPFWESRLQQALPFGAFGENITVLGLPEDEVCIGDIFEFGNAIIQITQPRQPCYKIAGKFGVPELVSEVATLGYTGYYARVLEEGSIKENPTMKLLNRDTKQVTISFANRLKYHERDNMQGVLKLLEVEALSDSWRTSFEKKLKQLSIRQGSTCKESGS